MNLKKLSFSHLIIFGIPLIIILSSVFLAKNLNYFGINSSKMAMAITIDLVITSPIIYFLLIRKSQISKFTVMPFFVAGLVIASFVLPSANRATLDIIIKWVLPVVELTVAAIVFSKIRKTRIEFKRNRAANLDFATALQKTTASLFPPKIAAAMATEIGLIYFTFFAWKKPNYSPNEFTYHKQSGALGVLGVLLGVALIELFAVHLLIYQNYPILSWVLSAISAYGIIQIIGLMKSIPRTPIQFDSKQLRIRMGIFQETLISYENIENVEFTMRDYPKADKSYGKITLFDHNCLIHLKEEAILKGLFGSTKSYCHLVLSVDDKARFLDTLNAFKKDEI